MDAENSINTLSNWFLTNFKVKTLHRLMIFDHILSANKSHIFSTVVHLPIWSKQTSEKFLENKKVK